MSSLKTFAFAGVQKGTGEHDTFLMIEAESGEAAAKMLGIDIREGEVSGGHFGLHDPSVRTITVTAEAYRAAGFGGAGERREIRETFAQYEGQFYLREVAVVRAPAPVNATKGQ